jgi:hypothetical protein
VEKNFFALESLDPVRKVDVVFEINYKIDENSRHIHCKKVN